LAFCVAKSDLQNLVDIVTEGSLALGYARWRASRLGHLTDTIELREVLRQCSPFSGEQVLDVGCGDGFFSIAIAKAGAAVTGVDTDKEMLGAANANAEREGVSVTFISADAHALPFQDATFDLVVAVSLLCLVRDRELALAEMTRVLKPGGRIVIGELGAWSLWNMWRRVRGAMGARPWRDAHFFTPAELRLMLQRAGLKTASVTGAIYYPPVLFLAALMSPLDSLFSRLGAFGAAFLLALAEQPCA
jgi:2-polyprenyl-3-methyl-5-hydroxy-6-metoxy-1,4-benzoquinol methylase